MPWFQASLTVRSATRMLPGTANTRSGAAVRYSSAAAIVTTLFTDPGSYGLDTAGLPRVVSSAEEKARGSNVRAFAIARTSPVFASSTTAEPPLAPFAAAYSASWRCIVYCRSESSVSCRSDPGVAGRSNRVLPGMTAELPSAVSTTRSPSCPASRLSCELSRPISPVSLRSVAFHDATPTTFAASAPPGYCRDSRFSSAISGYLSRSVRATSGSTSGTSTT